MTTNHPEKLDEALIRPGRVDHQVAFGNATQTQIKELFERMYTNDLPRTKLIISNPTSQSQSQSPSQNLSSPAPATLSPPSTTTSTSTSTTTTPSVPTPPATPINSQPPTSSNGLSKIDNTKTPLSESELSSIALSFSKQIPNGEFSPAEIQGFLLKRKTDPRKALAEVGCWVQGMLEQRRRGVKVVGVQ